MISLTSNAEGHEQHVFVVICGQDARARILPPQLNRQEGLVYILALLISGQGRPFRILAPLLYRQEDPAAIMQAGKSCPYTSAANMRTGGSCPYTSAANVRTGPSFPYSGAAAIRTGGQDHLPAHQRRWCTDRGVQTHR